MDCLQQGKEEDEEVNMRSAGDCFGKGRLVAIAAALAALFVLLVFLPAVYAAFPAPSAPDSMVNVSSSSPAATGGYELNTSGGTITTVNINATTQNPHWKAYVGNISGRLALQDAGSNAIYDWNITSMEGEVYATRESGIVAWDSVVCANQTHISDEESALNLTSSDPDSISSTFFHKSHASFYAGLVPVAENTCNSTNLYVNSAASSDFAEVLLYDGRYMVYAALIEESVTGFDGNRYDFQMIVPDSGLAGSQAPQTYYFYVELT
jgi:hypothetical protein